MKIAIMQPYFFPYVGYFQLINAVDKFIFYDDVTFIKQGWINRNRILMNGKDLFFTMRLQGASSNKLINEVDISEDNGKLLKTISQAYSKAPYYRHVIDLIEHVLAAAAGLKKISRIAELSVVKVSEYLNLKTVFETSSRKYSDTKSLERAERLIAICNKNDADTYINPSGGQELYEKETFRKAGINLFFIRNHIAPYKQLKHAFVAGLSIIDVMMFNSKDDIKNMLNEYTLL